MEGAPGDGADRFLADRRAARLLDVLRLWHWKAALAGSILHRGTAAPKQDATELHNWAQKQIWAEAR